MVEDQEEIQQTLTNPPPNYGEDITDDITVFKEEKTNEVVGIGIQEFKEKTKNLQDIKLKLPFEVNFSTIKT